MTDMFGGYQSQETRVLQSINSSKYPDTNVDLERNIQRLNSFVDYISQYLQIMQTGVDQANQDIFQQTREIMQNFGVLLAGGAIFDNDYGDLQYFLPAIGALLGFDKTTPFPINLFNAAENLLLGYVVPLDVFGDAIMDIVNNWADSLNLNQEFMTEVNEWVDAVGLLGAGFGELITNLFGIFDIFGVNEDGLGPVGQLWYGVSKLLGGFSLEFIGDLTDPILAGLAPWLGRITDAVSWLSDIIKSWSNGLEDIAGIINFSGLFGNINWAAPDFNLATAIHEWVSGIILPTNIFANAVEFLTVSDLASQLDESVDNLLAWFSDILSRFGLGQVSQWIDDLLVTRGATNTALTNASTAQAKADLAESLANVGVLRAKFGSNILYSPTFENTTIQYSPYTSLTVSAYSYSTEYRHSGTKSLRVIYDSAAVTAGEQGIQMRVEPSEPYLLTQPQSWYWVEAWYYVYSTHSNSGRLQLFADTKDSLGVNAPQKVYVFDQPFSGLAKNVWTKISGHIQLPVGRDQFTLVIARSGCVLNDVVFFDDMVMREVTEAKLANAIATAAQALANTAESLAQQALANFTAILNRFGFTQIADWIEDLFGVKTTASTGSANASTALTNAATADTKAVTAQTSNQTTVNYLYDAFDGTTGNTGRTAAEVRTRGATVRSTAVTGSTNASTALTNAATADTKAVTATTNAATAQTQANLGVTNAATAQTQANLGVTNAAAAQTSANTAVAFANTAIVKGQSFVTNPGFENSGFYLSAGAYSTEQKRTGTQSLKLTGTSQWVRLQSNASAALRQPVAAGDVFFFEGYVYGHANNTSAAGTITVQFNAFTAAGATATPSAIASSTTMTQAMNGVWTRFNGTLVIGAATNIQMVDLYLGSAIGGTNAANIYYFDDVVVYRVTEGYNADAKAVVADSKAVTATTNAATADTKAVAAQTNLDLRAADFANLVSGSDFENAVNPWQTGTGFMLDSTTLAHSGTKSMKISSGASGFPGWSYDVTATYTFGRRFECKAGDQFYMESWSKRDAAYVSNDAGGPRFRCVRGSGRTTPLPATPVGSTIEDINFLASTMPVADTWYKLTFVVTVPDDGTSSVYFVMQGMPANALGNVWVDDLVVRRVVVPEVLAALPQSKVTDLTTNLSTITTQANLGVTNAATAQTQATLGVTNAATADTKAVVAKSIANTSLQAGSNLVTDPNCLNTNLYLSSRYSTDFAYTGTKSIKLTGNVTQHLVVDDVNVVDIPCVPGDVFYCESWTRGAATNSVTAGAIYIQAYGQNATKTSGFWLNPTPLNASPALNGVWTKMSGNLTIPAGCYFIRIATYTSGVGAAEVYYVGGCKFYRVTEASAADAKAVTATTNAATADTKAVTATTNAATADSKAVTATTNAATAQTQANLGVTNAATAQTQANLGVTNAAAADAKAIVAQNIIDSKMRAGKNLATNPECSDADAWKSAGQWTPSITTEEKRSGTTSLKLVITGAGYPAVGFMRTAAGGSDATGIAVRPGDKFYMECWARAKSTNVSVGKTWGIQGWSYDSTGTVTYSFLNNLVTLSTTAWTKITHTFTIPAGRDRFQVSFTGSNGNTAGDTFYVDDLILLDVTDTQDVIDNIVQGVAGGTATGYTLANVKSNVASVNSQANTGVTNAATAQTQANLGVTNAAAAATTANAALPKVTFDASNTGGANLATNPSFEDTSQYLWANSSYSTDFARTGTRSIKLTAVAGADRYVSPINVTGDIAYVNVVPGQVFYVEFWMYQTGGTVTAADNSTMVYVQFFDGSRAYANIAVSALLLGSAVAHNGVWTKVSGTFTTPVGTYNSLRVLIRMTNITAVGTVRYYDDVVIRDITEASVADAKAVTATTNAATADSKAVTATTNAATADSKAVTATTNAATADSKAVTATTNAATADTKAVTATTNAATADTKAVAAQGFANNALRLGSNILPNGGFENTSFYIGNGVYNTAFKLSGSWSARLTGSGVRANLTTGFQSSDTFVNSVPCRPSATFYVEGWVYGAAANAGGGQIQIYVDDFNSAGVLQPQQYAGHTASTALRSGVWSKITATITVSSSAASVYIFIYHSGQPATDVYYYDNFIAYEITNAAAADAKAVTATTNAATADAKSVATNQALYGANTPASTITQNKVAGLPDSLLPVSQTLIEHAQDIVDLKAAKEVTVNQGRTMSISFVQLANANDMPTTGTQTWSTQYLTGSGPTFGITSGKAAWKSSGTRSAKVLYRGTATRQLISTGTGGTFTLTLGATTTTALAHNATAATVLAALGSGNVSISGTSALSPGLTITPVSTISGALSITSSVTGGTATLSDGIESTLTDYQSLRGVLAGPPGIFGVESSGFTALARVSQDGNSYVFARAYWVSGLNLRGRIGYCNNGVETTWQNDIPLTWSTELTFRLGVDGNPRAYQVFSGTTLVVRYDEGYSNFDALTAITSKATGRTYVDNTGNRLTVTATAGTFTLTVLGVTTTAAIAFNATAATVATALNTALNAAYVTTGVTYATVTGTAANTVGTPGGLVVTFNVKVKGQTPGNTNMSVNPALLTGGTATVANRYTWSGTAFVPSAATTGAGAASPLGVGNRRFGAEVRTVGSNNSGTISSVAVSDNPPVVYAGSVARMTRLNTATATMSSSTNALASNFFDDVEYESLDIEAQISDGTFTVSKSKMYMVTARIRLSTYFTSQCYAVLQRWDAATGIWTSVQDGVPVWPYDSFHNVQPTNSALTGTWLQYLNAGDKVRLGTWRDAASTSVLMGAADGSETYFSISALQ